MGSCCSPQERADTRVQASGSTILHNPEGGQKASDLVNICDSEGQQNTTESEANIVEQNVLILVEAGSAGSLHITYRSDDGYWNYSTSATQQRYNIIINLDQVAEIQLAEEKDLYLSVFEDAEGNVHRPTFHTRERTVGWHQGFGFSLKNHSLYLNFENNHSGALLWLTPRYDDPDTRGEILTSDQEMKPFYLF